MKTAKQRALEIATGLSEGLIALSDVAHGELLRLLAEAMPDDASTAPADEPSPLLRAGVTLQRGAALLELASTSPHVNALLALLRAGDRAPADCMAEAVLALVEDLEQAEARLVRVVRDGQVVIKTTSLSGHKQRPTFCEECFESLCTECQDRLAAEGG